MEYLASLARTRRRLLAERLQEHRRRRLALLLRGKLSRHCEERKRRSNPEVITARTGLLRFARNDELKENGGRSDRPPFVTPRSASRCPHRRCGCLHGSQSATAPRARSPC